MERHVKLTEPIYISIENLSMFSYVLTWNSCNYVRVVLNM